jgi:hypothetical protein
MADRHTDTQGKEAQPMGYAELIERLRTLPQEKQAEVFDFVEFLSARAQGAEFSGLTRDDWSDTDFSALAMTQALRGIEDDPVVYTRADLQEQWQ